MGWSWAEFLATPLDVIAAVLVLYDDEQAAIRKASQGR